MKRALVLGGGGPVGIAWEAGLIAGLAEGGVDLAQADLIVGTSAGSFVGSQLASGRKAGDLAAAILAEAERPRSAAPASDAGGGAGGAPDLALLFQKMQEAASGERDSEAVRREIGAFALAAQTMDEAAFIKSFGRQLSERQSGSWPAPSFACTAVDAETGAFVVWDQASGVDLAHAVASSCSVPGVYPPVTVKGRRYIDGGMRSATNADLAKDHDLVVIVALRLAGGDPAMAERMRRPLEAEMQSLKDGGARVELITPDAASQAAFGPNLMDFRMRPAAAGAGSRQGQGMASVLKAAWG